MLETSEQRIKLLKAGFSGKEIERLYIEYNNFKIVHLPILYEILEFNGVKIKNFKLKQLDEKIEEIADALISLGLGRDMAMTLAYMLNTNFATSIELERAARLGQTEVSIAIRQLKERDWISEREEKNPVKGGPNMIYSLKVKFNDIIAQLEKQQFDEKDEEIADTLISLGVGRNMATTLAYMQNTNFATSLELERAARLRQLEVNIAMKHECSVKEFYWLIGYVFGQKWFSTHS
jgi:predicted transcriptional regulator